ncbi:MAG: type II toxin-antitoxin system prevent-host-death family antitoxin [Acidobacteria bacterium]|nr:MAG: type II toxin-antitoxin system prevent-host-death family antitoxin [Acidobacteriota bacterium]
MVEMVTISDARTRLSELVLRVERGEEIVITRRGRPVARLVSFRENSIKRKPGRMRGRIRMRRHFDEPLFTLFSM